MGMEAGLVIGNGKMVIDNLKTLFYFLLLNQFLVPFLTSKKICLKI